MVDGEVALEVGVSPSNTTIRDNPATEPTHTHNTTNARVAPARMGKVKCINLDSVGSVEMLDILQRVALC